VLLVRRIENAFFQIRQETLKGRYLARCGVWLLLACVFLLGDETLSYFARYGFITLGCNTRCQLQRAISIFETMLIFVEILSHLHLVLESCIHAYPRDRQLDSWGRYGRNAMNLGSYGTTQHRHNDEMNLQSRLLAEEANRQRH